MPVHRPPRVESPRARSSRRETPVSARPMDLSLFKDINGFAFHHDAFEDTLRFIAQDAQWFFVALLGVLFLAWGEHRSLSGRHGVAAAGFAALLALGIAQVIAGIVDR